MSAAAEFAAAAMEAPDNWECWYSLGRANYFQERWRDCTEAMERALACDRFGGIAPDRKRWLHVYYNFALNKLGRVADALASAEAGLASVPSDPMLLENRRVYRRYLALRDAREQESWDLPVVAPVFPGTSSQNLNIVVWTGPALAPWCPADVDTSGLGGSETACVQVARGLCALGHQVVVYGDCRGNEGIYDGVRYFDYRTAPPRFDCDVFISSRCPDKVDAAPFAKATFLWMHDLHMGDATMQLVERLNGFDQVVAVSRWHRSFLIEKYSLKPDRVTFVTNGVDTSRFPEPLEPRANRLIYSSAHDRGLDVLLEIFPRIRREVVDAELHVFNGPAGAEREGVVWRGRVGQAELAAAFLEAKVLAYPTAFHETSCITAMEAQAAGCVPVATRLAALTETAAGGVLVEGSNDTREYQDAFCREVVDLLVDDEKRRALSRSLRESAMATFDWRSSVASWTRILEAPRPAKPRSAGAQEILVKLPVRSRREKLFTILRAWSELASRRHYVRFLVSIDHDDVELNRPDVLANLASFHDLKYTIGFSTTKIEAVNDGLEGERFDILIVASDDMVPLVEGYDDRIAKDMMDSFPNRDGALHYDDGHFGVVLNTLPILGYNLFKKLGYVYHPSYKSLWADNELTEACRAMNKMVYIDEVLIRHDNPWFTGEGRDELFHTNDSYNTVDKENFERRRSVGFGVTRPQLSILICSLQSRATLRERVLAQLNAQIDDLAKPDAVEIQVIVDDGAKPTGEKRNELMALARGRYLCFVDDDDTVSSSYVAKLLSAIESGADCIVFKGLRSHDGVVEKEFWFSIGHDYVDSGPVYLRFPNHLCPMKAEIARSERFAPVSIQEDIDWATRIRPKLRTEHVVDDVLYFYQHVDPRKR